LYLLDKKVIALKSDSLIRPHAQIKG